MTSQTGSRSPRWLWIAVLWGGVGLFDATETVVMMRSQGMHHRWPQLFATILLTWLPWALATPVIMFLGNRFPPVRLRPLSTWAVHMGAATAINAITAAWRAGMDVFLDPWAYTAGAGPFTSIWVTTFNDGLLATAIFYASILSIAYVLDSRERLARQQTEAARLNEQISKTQLEALRQQIEPHFLFNALNTVSALVRENRNEDALTMIAGLSDLLRDVLRDSRKQQVPLREELQLLDKYLAIQKVRFSDRLRIETEIPAGLLSAQVPSLLLQPIVENALKHGISKRVQGGLVSIAASRQNGRLRLCVYNDGPNLSSDWNNTGVGISNLIKRLQRLYGQNFEFGLRSPESGGVQASISVPYVTRKLVE